MGKFLLVLIASLNLTTAAAAGEAPASVDVGGKNIAVPAPAGLVDAAAAGPKAVAFAESVTPKSNRALLLFIPQDQLASLASDEKPVLMKYAMLQSNRQFNDRDVSPDMFSFVSRFVKSQILGKEAVLNQAIKEGAKEGAAEAKNISVGETKPLAMIRDDKRAMSSLLLLKVAYAKDGTNLEIPLLSTMSLVHLQSRLLYVYVYTVYLDETDLNWIRTTTEQWLKDMLDANPV